MTSGERKREARILDSLFGPESTARKVAEREQRDPNITRLKQIYTEQAEAISKKLEMNSLTVSQRVKLGWHLAVLQWRAEHGPEIHCGYYNFNFLPDHLAQTNPQLRRTA